MQKVLTRVETRMKKTLSVLTNEYTTIRTGRADLAILNKIMTDYCDTPTAMNQLVAISVSEAWLLTIQPWDVSSVRIIERMILSSKFSINPQDDGKVIRLMFPQLTEGRRRDITRNIAKMSGETKVTVYSTRRDVVEKLKARRKAAGATEDDLKQGEKKTQDLTDKYCKEVDVLFEEKQKEIMEIQNRFMSHVSDQEQLIVPRYLGIVMNGNGRWAERRDLPCSADHTVGATNFERIVRYCAPIGIKYLTVYAFSTGNWRRPLDETEALMKAFQQYLEGALRGFLSENTRVRSLGDPLVSPQHLQNLFVRIEEVSTDKTGMVLNIVMDYGDCMELIHVVRLLAERVQKGTLLPGQVTEDLVSQHFYMVSRPDPDLVLRPNGEYRIPNSLLWQSAYTEYIIMDKLWPDFAT